MIATLVVLLSLQGEKLPIIYNDHPREIKPSLPGPPGDGGSGGDGRFQQSVPPTNDADLSNLFKAIGLAKIESHYVLKFGDSKIKVAHGRIVLLSNVNDPVTHKAASYFVRYLIDKPIAPKLLVSFNVTRVRNVGAGSDAIIGQFLGKSGRYRATTESLEKGRYVTEVDPEKLQMGYLELDFNRGQVTMNSVDVYEVKR